MPLTAKSTGNNFVLIEEGNFMARCIRVIDLGTQKSTFQGKEVSNRKVLIAWETPDELHEFSTEKGLEPFMVHKEYTLSLGKQANLRHDLISWRGSEFTKEEEDGFNVEKLLGVPCQILVTHKTSATGNVRAEIKSITKLMKGATCLPQINPSIFFSFESFDRSEFDKLPEWICKKIQLSPEWQACNNDFVDQSEQTGYPKETDDLGEPIPF